MAARPAAISANLGMLQAQRSKHLENGNLARLPYIGDTDNRRFRPVENLQKVSRSLNITIYMVRYTL